MTADAREHGWPPALLGDAVIALGRHSGLGALRKGAAPRPPRPEEHDPAAADAFLGALAAHLGLEAEPVLVPYTGVAEMLRRAGPMLLRLDGADGPRYLPVVRGGRRTVLAIGADGRARRLPVEAVRRALCEAVEAPHEARVESLLSAARLRAGARVRQALLRQRLAGRSLRGAWLLRRPPGASFLGQLRAAGVLRRLGGVALLHLLVYGTFLLSFFAIGKGALSGSLDLGWLAAWGLLLLSGAALRALLTAWQGEVAIRAGGLLKRRLLFGALELQPEEVRHQGAGELLGRVIESEQVEALALGGGLLALTALLELAAAAAVLAVGAGRWLSVLLLVFWGVIAALLCRAYWRSYRGWTGTRLWLSGGLTERILGHRTRLAQLEPARLHEDEDQELGEYVGASRRMDRAAARVLALVPRGALAVGLLGLAPSFLTGRASPAALAVGLGGSLAAQRAFAGLVGGLLRLFGAAAAFSLVAPLYRAAARGASARRPPPLPPARPSPGQPILTAHDLAFRYRPERGPVLRGVDLRVCAGERVLLLGSSGSGKSTLVSLLCGLRRPESGLILLSGLDQHSLAPSEWRRRVVAAPQFHENHVLTETFFFNLLLGRPWPPRPTDEQEAAAVCEELGLSPLLQRMPAGLLQSVGESGWQLSHGERSRLYIARALLQGADVVVLDESFAALDPETLEQVMRCVRQRAATLLVVAHP